MKFREFLLDASFQNTTLCVSPVSKWSKWIEIHLDNDNKEMADACGSIPYDCLLDMEVGSWRLYTGFDSNPTIEIELFMDKETEQWFLGLDEVQTMGGA